MSKPTHTGKIRRAYEFIKAHRFQHDVRMMCRVLDVAPSGYYAWLQEPISTRAQDDARLLRLICASFTASHGIYGSPRVFLDLREAGETCSKHRVARPHAGQQNRALQTNDFACASRGLSESFVRVGRTATSALPANSPQPPCRHHSYDAAYRHRVMLSRHRGGPV
jgi:hypothetical protein